MLFIAPVLTQVAADLVDCDRLDVTFEDIAGMESVKQSLQEIVSEPLDFPPDLYPVCGENKKRSIEHGQLAPACLRSSRLANASNIKRNLYSIVFDLIICVPFTLACYHLGHTTLCSPGAAL